MSYADRVFKDMCRDILQNGTDTKGERVRPVWEDTGESAYTIKKFGVVNRYDLRKEFPALTLRRTAIKSAFDEVLWIYQRKSNNVHDLSSHIWDAWADEDGSVGTCYGWVIGQKFLYRGERIDQTDYVLRQLKENPYSRRIMTNMYQFEHLHGGGLDPCAYSMTYNVTAEPGSDRLVLNAVLNQRSNDVLTANNWNVVQYALLLMMLAQVNGMTAGELVHVIADAHIYDRHVPMIEELLARKEYPAPAVKLNPDITDFYRFTKDDLSIENYQYGEPVGKIPVAV